MLRYILSSSFCKVLHSTNLRIFVRKSSLLLSTFPFKFNNFDTSKIYSANNCKRVGFDGGQISVSKRFPQENPPPPFRSRRGKEGNERFDIHRERTSLGWVVVHGLPKKAMSVRFVG